MKLQILYGSQTGWAEDVSLRLYNAFYRNHIEVNKVCAMDDYDIEDILEESITIFICSTTGEGDEPDNMKNFWRFLLRKNLPNDFLNGMQYAVFGLGDSSYQKFNFVAKKMFRRLAMLGAEALINRADGDDQHYLGLDAAFIPWQQNLISKLKEVLNIKDKGTLSMDSLPPPSFKFKLVEHVDYIKTHLEEGWKKFNVVQNDRITPNDHFQDARHLVFEKEDEEELNFKEGDIALFQPYNLDEEVDEFLKLINLEDIADNYYFIESNNIRSLPQNIEQPIQLRNLIKKVIDLHSTPKTSFFEYMYKFSNNEIEKEKHLEFINDVEELINYTIRPRRTLLECLNDFNSFRFSLEYLLDAFRFIKPRSFSIANFDSNKVELLVGIVDYKSKMIKRRTGFATKFIKKELRVGDKILLKIKRGSFRLPSDDIPIIMVGPGLGVAPFRNFIQSRIANHAYSNYLFFGCRFKDKDNYFYNEFNQYHNDNKLHFKVAYSREKSFKVYVQDTLLESKDLILDLIINQDAIIYVCGSSKNMPNQVEETFKSIFKVQVEDVDAYLDSLKKVSRYQVECWD